LTQQRPKGGHETILVAEDNEDLRDFVVCVLESHGYKVISASSGQEALAHWAKGNETIQLLLTDIVMPGGLSGRQLAENLLAKNPALRVLYTSGYTPGMAGQDLALLEGHAFLAKPYEPATLVQRVRECLDGRLRSPAKCPTTLGTPASVQNESFGP
jgi:CheY-like chemotaxis protein